MVGTLDEAGPCIQKIVRLPFQVYARVGAAVTVTVKAIAFSDYENIKHATWSIDRKPPGAVIDYVISLTDFHDSLHQNALIECLITLAIKLQIDSHSLLRPAYFWFTSISMP